MADVSCFGLRPGAHHAVNAMLHALNAVLLFLLLRRTTGHEAPAALVAAIFAVHPLQVESVAWISQRKTVLSMALVLATLHAYAAWTRRGGAARYAAALAAFAAALAAKPTAVVVPLLLLAFECWPLGRFGGERRDVSSGSLFLKYVPFAVLAGASSIVTLLAQKQAAALGTLESHSLLTRLAHAIYSYAWYPARMVWPSGLSLFYPMDLGANATAKIALSAGFLLAALGMALVLAGSRPYVVAGIAWYGAALLPVSGLIPFGTQLVADRYAYLPLVGLFAALVWGLRDAALGRGRALGRLAALASVAAIVTLSLLTRAQLVTWRDSESLLSRGVARAPENVHALFNYGLWLAEAGRVDEALPLLTRAVELAPSFRTGGVNLGWALAKAGRLDEARARYEEALGLLPQDPPLLAELGRVLALLGRREEAESRLREAIRLDPASAAGHLLLGTLLHDGGRPQEAEPYLERSFALMPGDPRAGTALGTNLAALGRTQEALEVLRKAAVPGPAGDRARLEMKRLTP
jgi:Flp pilus assembly protein TadD